MNTPHRVVSALPTGTAFSRFLMAKAIEDQSGTAAALEIAGSWRDSPTVHATLVAELQSKSAVSAATTSDVTWAAPLAQYGIAAEALQLLRGASILGALENRFRRVPLRTRVSREVGSGSGGAWVGEGLATPVAATAYDTLSVESYKAATIIAMSRELQKVGDPNAELTVRTTVIAGVGAYLDAQFLTPSVTLSPNLRPASVTNGATAVASTGTTAAAITADLMSMLGAITTTGGTLVWVMRPLTAAKITGTLGAAATGAPSTLFGIPVVVSANSPQQVTLIDCAHILFADEGQFDVSISQQAAIIMDSAPGAVVQTAAAAPTHTSLFQNNLWAVRVVRWLSYLRAQTGAVSYMLVSY